MTPISMDIARSIPDMLNYIEIEWKKNNANTVITWRCHFVYAVGCFNFKEEWKLLALG